MEATRKGLGYIGSQAGPVMWKEVNQLRNGKFGHVKFFETEARFVAAGFRV